MLFSFIGKLCDVVILRFHEFIHMSFPFLLHLYVESSYLFLLSAKFFLIKVYLVCLPLYFLT